MSDYTQWIERFRRGSELLALAMTGAAGPELDYKAEPGRWSVRQLICHLADTEMVLAVRLRQVIAEENPSLPNVDQNLWAEKLDYSRRKPSAVMDSFRRMRAENHELLKELPAETFDRRGTHSVRGEMSLANLLEDYTMHAETHILQIRQARAAYKESRAKA